MATRLRGKRIERVGRTEGVGAPLGMEQRR